MPDNPAALLAEVTAAFFPVLIPVQAGLFLLLLLSVSFCDIRSREIPHMETEISTLAHQIDNKSGNLDELVERQTMLIEQFERAGHFPVHLGFYAPFPHGRRKMVGILSD